MPTCVGVLVLDPVALELLIQALLFLQYERILLGGCTSKALLEWDSLLQDSPLLKSRRSLDLILSAFLKYRCHA